MLQVLGQIDGRHPARAEFALDGVAVGECRFEAVKYIGHDDGSKVDD